VRKLFTVGLEHHWDHSQLLTNATHFGQNTTDVQYNNCLFHRFLTALCTAAACLGGVLLLWDD